MEGLDSISLLDLTQFHYWNITIELNDCFRLLMYSIVGLRPN